MKPKLSFAPGLAGALAVVFSCSAFAGDEGQPRTVIGEATEAYLQMQRDGASAGRAQPVTGEVASRSYQRYLNSFDEPMPQTKSGSGSTSSSNSKPASTSTAAR